ncbi:MAG: hypothetical protein RJA44_709 [Pseudomonadota bacterium]
MSKRSFSAPSPIRWPGRWLRRTALGLALTGAALGLAACGGGSEPVPIDISVIINGQSRGSYAGSSELLLQVGQSLELDAREPVVWTLDILGTWVDRNGTIRYAGGDVTLTTLSSSRAAIDTYAPGFLSTSIPITLIATSTIDGAQVATVYARVTN